MTNASETPSTEVATTAEGSAALTAGAVDPYAAAANEMANNFLPIVKMTKAGEWVSGPDEEELEDHEAAFAMNTFAHGFVCWKDGEVVDEKMVLVASGELRPLFVLYRPSSRGGLNALAGLARKYANKRQRQPNVVPIVRLETKSYAHRQYGKIFNPILRVLDWKEEPDLVVAATAVVPANGGGDVVPDLNDEIPY